MTWRHVALYWTIFLLLSVYQLAALSPDLSDEPSLSPRESGIEVDVSRIAGFRLHHGSVTLLGSRIEGGRWQIEPANLRVPTDLLAAYVDAMSALGQAQVVDDDTKNAKQFGLDPPYSEITLNFTQGDPLKVLTGASNPAGTAIYAAIEGKPEIYLIGMDLRYYESLLLEQATAVAENSHGP